VRGATPCTEGAASGYPEPLVSRLRGTTRQGLAALAAAMGGAALLAASAFALVTIYSNGFANKSAYNEVSRAGGGGGGCAREFRKSDGEMRVTVKEGPVHCEYVPPAQGDGPQPDHNFLAHSVVGGRTPAAVDDTAFVSVSVRVGGGNHYQLRVFPKTDAWQLRRQPAGVGFPASGTNPAIKGLGKVNQIELAAVGNEVRAFVNDAPLTVVVGASPGQPEGERVQFGVGQEATTGRDTFGSITKVALRVPDP
jgi:hypothetical protein